MMRVGDGLFKVGAIALVFTLTVATPAGAKLESIRHGFATWLNGVENVYMAPADAVLAPVIAARTVHTNLADSDMSTFGKGVTWFVGIPWVSTLQWVVTGARIVSGVAETNFGIALMLASPVMDVREHQLFDASGASPLVNHEGPFDVVIGGHYVSSH